MIPKNLTILEKLVETYGNTTEKEAYYQLMVDYVMINVRLHLSKERKSSLNKRVMRNYKKMKMSEKT